MEGTHTEQEKKIGLVKKERKKRGKAVMSGVFSRLQAGQIQVAGTELQAGSDLQQPCWKPSQEKRDCPNTFLS